MTLHRGRAHCALRRRAAAVFFGLALSTCLLVNPVLSRAPWAQLATDAGEWLSRCWAGVGSSLEAFHQEVERSAAELRGTLGSARRDADDARLSDLIAFGGMRVPRRVAEEVVRAANATAVDPVYLMALADKESSFRVQVHAATSSAAGLFQFVEGTWLQMLREFGARHGFLHEARAITLVAGRPVVRDAAERERILALRYDPYLSAVMAAELLKRSEARLVRELARPLAPTEWYLAHFLGTGDALRLLRSRAERPQAQATQLLPAAARANRTLFTRPTGRRRAPLTVDELYARIERMMGERLDRYGNVQALAGPGQLATEWY